LAVTSAAPPGKQPPEIEAALAALDMTPVFAIAESNAWMALSTAKDPDVELRMFKTRNARVTGFAFLLYAENEVYARRVVAMTLRQLENKYVRVDGRWAGATADIVQQVLCEVARGLGSALVTPGERLARAINKAEAKARAAEAAVQRGRGLT